MKREHSVMFGLLTDGNLDGEIVSIHTNKAKALKAQKEYLKDKKDCFSYIKTEIIEDEEMDCRNYLFNTPNHPTQMKTPETYFDELLEAVNEGNESPVLDLIRTIQEEAFIQGCKAQRELCVKAYIDAPVEYEANKAAILNAPLPKMDYKCTSRT